MINKISWKTCIGISISFSALTFLIYVISPFLLFSFAEGPAPFGNFNLPLQWLVFGLVPFVLFPFLIGFFVAKSVNNKILNGGLSGLIYAIFIGIFIFFLDIPINYLLILLGILISTILACLGVYIHQRTYNK